MNHTKRPQAELIIKRRDKTEVRHVRPLSNVDTAPVKSELPDDQDHKVVMECAPYTTSFNNLLEEVRHCEDPVRFATLAYQRMRAEGIPLNTKTYNLLMLRVVSVTSELMFEFYDRLKEEGTMENCSVRPDVETYQLLFRACQRSAQYHKAFLLYQQMREIFNLVPPTSVYNTLLGFCAAANDVAQATYFIEEMKANNVPLDANSYNCYMNALVGNAPYKETQRLFNEMSDARVAATSRTYNSMILSARVHDDYDRTFQLFEEMKRKGLIPDIITYNSLLKMCEGRLDYVLGRGRYAGSIRTNEQKTHGKQAVSELALTLLTEMDGIPIAPNTYSYNRVLSVLLQCSDYRVFDIYKKVVAAYDAPTTARDMISTGVCADMLSEAEAHNIVEAAMRSENSHEEACIRASGVLPNVETYNLIIQACLELEHMHDCKNLISSMKKHSVAMDRSIAMKILTVCSKSRDKCWAEDILREATEKGLLIDVDVFNAYMKVLSAVADESIAKEFELMKLGINRYGTKANSESYNIMMQSFLDRGELSKCEEVFTEMRCPNATVMPNDESYCLAIRLYERLKKSEVPISLIQSCMNSKTQLGIEVFESLLQMFANLRDGRIETWFESLRSSSMPCLPPASVMCYSIIMNYFLAEQRYDDVIRLFNSLKVSHTLEADASVYRVLFEMYRRQGNCKAMVALFDDANLNMVKLDIEMYNLILTTLVNRKDQFTWKVLKDMKTNRVPPADSTIAIFLKSADGRSMLTEIVQSDLFYRPGAQQFFI